MLSRHNSEIQSIVDSISILTNEFITGIKNDEYADEEDMTSKFTQLLQNALVFDSAEFTVSSKLVTLKKHTEEPPVGADFLIVLSFVSPELSQTKGVLVQAKKKDYGKNFSSAEFNKLKEQCQKMITFTPDSFVWTYSSEKIRVHRAYMVEALVEEETRSIDEACYMSVPGFFNAFLRCYNGDPALSFRNIDRLNSVIEAMKASSILLVSLFSKKENPVEGGAGNPNKNPPDLDSLAKEILDSNLRSILARKERLILENEAKRRKEESSGKEEQALQHPPLTWK